MKIKYLGNFSEHPYYSIPFQCEYCNVSWGGCSAAPNCPQCGRLYSTETLEEVKDMNSLRRRPSPYWIDQNVFWFVCPAVIYTIRQEFDGSYFYDVIMNGNVYSVPENEICS